MPTKTNNHKRSCPVSLDQKHIDYIERAGNGKDFSKKIRSIIERAMNQHDVLVTYEGTVLTYSNPSAVCVYTETGDGERIWEKLPFTYNKKNGWRGIEKAAADAGYTCQNYTLEEEGFVTVWIAKSLRARTCEDCKAKIMEIIG